MADSTYVFDRGSAIEVGAHGADAYVFESGTPVENSGGSALVFESGTAWGAGPGQITCRLRNAAGSLLSTIGPVTDTAFRSGGIGFHIGTGDCYWDLAKIAGGAVIDDFEDNDLTEYAVSNPDSPGAIRTGTTHVYEGTYSLEMINNPSPPNNIEILMSTSGLNAYPSPGDTFSVRLYRAASGSRGHFAFGVQSETASATTNKSPDMYDVATGGSFDLYRVQGGTRIKLAGSSPGIPTGEFLEVEVEWV